MSDITPQQRQRLKKLFDEALKVESSRRAAFVARECAGDEWLLDELRSLLAVHDEATDFLEAPPPGDRQDTSTEGRPINRYTIIRPLGEGGMGKVYLALDRRLGREVALKFLPTDTPHSRELLARLLQEARVAATLKHPNICVVYEMAGPGDEQPFIAMEYVEGGTLRQRLSRKRMKLNEALDVAVQVASALTAGHKRGVVHRDIKPDNIMLGGDGSVKVLDFGLAKLTRQEALTPPEEAGAPPPAKTEPGAVMGTVDYMSPEQLRGLEVDARTDIWSLGVVLYLMVAHKHPFKGPTTSDTIAAVIGKEPAPLSSDAGLVSAELERVIRKALAKNRKERYQSAEKMAADLRRFRESVETVGTFPRHRKRWKVAAAAVLLTVSAFAYYFYSTRKDSVAANSIAVLPFVDDDPQPDTEYLSEGLTDNLINDLSKFSNLRVVARTSVFHYKGREVDPRKIGRELKVQVILMGRILRRGDTITVNIELMDVRDNRHLGGGHYSDRESELISLQKRLSQEVFQYLQLNLKGFVRRQEAPKYTDNAEAYRLYLLGRYFWNKRSEEGFRKSIEYFQQAIEKDPHFAPSFAGLADAYFVLGQWSAEPLKEATGNARQAVLRSLELDDELPEAHIAFGDIKLYYDYDWDGARAEYERAIVLGPSSAYAHNNYALYFSFTGQHDAALAESTRAQQLDPLSIYINASAAEVLFLARDYDRAIEQCRRVLEIDESVGARLTLGWSYEQKGMYTEAIEEFQQYHRLAGDPETLDVLAHAHARAGDVHKARALLDEMKRGARPRGAKRRGAIVDPSAYAIIHLGLDEENQAFDLLEKAYEYRSPNLTLLHTHPYFDRYRSEPRFIDLLKRVGP